MAVVARLGVLSLMWMVCSAVFAVEGSVLLSEARSKLDLPKSNEAERETILNQAEFFLQNLYVHRDLKIKDFGSSVDPIPALQKLRENSSDLSDDSFYQSLSEVFLNLRDLHTTYKMPAPRQCGVSFLSLRFESVVENGKNLVLVSQKLSADANLLTKVSLGDKLVEYDGKKIEAVISEVSKFSSGANLDAQRLRALKALSMRALSTQPIPKDDVVQLKLVGANGKSYELELPWRALVSEICLSTGGRTDGSTDISPLTLFEDEFQKRFNQIYGSPRLLSKKEGRWARVNETDEVFEVGTVSTPAGKMGYIVIKTFIWENRKLDVGILVDAFRRALESKLSDTIGLIIDVRGNPGGHILLAERLLQLFSKHQVKPTKVTMLANELNEQVFQVSNGSDNRWSEAIQASITKKEKYIAPISLTPLNEANNLGQVYFKPVVVLTDAACYSACDIFTAGMQDSGAAHIIGLHKSTGGGGANVMDYGIFRAILGGSENADNPFVRLPFGQGMRVAWRQTIRVGTHAGELIENKGVISDTVIPFTTKDLVVGPKDLLTGVQNIVIQLLPSFKSGLAVRTGGIVMLKNGEKASWKESVYGIDSLEVLQGTKKLKTLSVKESEEPSDIEIVLKDLKAEWSDLPVVLVGKSKGNEVFRSVRELKWRGEYLEIPEEGTSIDFEDGTLGELHAVLLHGGSKSGWQVVDGKLRVGVGPKYENSVHTRVFWPIKLNSEAAELSWNIKLQAEEIHDSLRIYALNPDTGNAVQLFAGSQMKAGVEGLGMRFPKGWDRAEVVFEFESDENWNFEGPILDNFKLEKK